MNIREAVEFLSKQVPRPATGLPEELFFYISKVTPLVNVDLLIKDEDGRTLLAWRDDQYTGKGWHVPGGIIRFKETLEARIKKVAETEIGVNDIKFDIIPIAINQCIHPERDVRSHFISILYRCFLHGGFIPENKGLSPQDGGYLMWHEHCPENLLKFHEVYRGYI